MIIIKINKFIYITCLTFYLIILTWIIIFKLGDQESLIDNYHILITLNDFERLTMLIVPFINLDIKDFILNILIFIPFGFLILFMFEDIKFTQILFIGFEVSLVYEILQFFTLLGGFSSNDLIANTIGTCTGYLLFKLIIDQKQEKTKLIFSSIISFIMFPLMIYSIINTLSAIDLYSLIITRNL